MTGWTRRLRGALGMGLTWAIGWLPFGAAMGAFLYGLTSTPPAPLLQAVLVFAATLGLVGFLSGTLFSMLLRLTEGRKRFDELSLPRFAVWGALGGLVLGLACGAVGLWGIRVGSALGLAMVGAATVLGGASAAGTLALARGADDRDLLQADSEVDEAGLSKEELDSLLG